MKKIYLILILLLSFNLQAQQVKVYNVIRVSSNDIYCGTSATPLENGSTINDNSIIQWKNYHQWFEAKDSDGKTRYFSKESMESRHKRTISEYLKDLINRCVNTTSGKGVEKLLAGKNKDMYSEKRLALVIGNANYNNIASLRNPLNDASLISGDLRELGFDVMCLYDGTTREIGEVLETFREKVMNEHYDLVLFYYSGHGLKSDYKNWIVPINAKLDSHSDLRYECIDGHYLMEKIKESGCSNSIVIMDACRTEINWSKAAMQGGAISIEPELNMLLAFSTRDYEEAKDIVPNVKGYGPYAAALSKALRTEGLTLDELFQDVKNQVYKNTSGSQSPIHTNDVRKEIILHAKKTTTNNKTSSSTSSVPNSNNKQNIYPQTESLEGGQAKSWTEKGNQFFQDHKYEQGVDCYNKAAEFGDMVAQRILGSCYQFGIGTIKNYYEAVKWYEKAANQGDTVAQSSMGFMWLNGYGVPRKDKQIAIQWYKKAAEKGYLEAQKNLGSIYYMETNYYEARKWYEKAAEQGDAYSYSRLGFMWLNGYGVPHKDTRVAMQWYKKAAEKGYPDAQNAVGALYLQDNNYSEAKKWFEKAAINNSPAAQYNLGQIYMAQHDKVKAVEWYKKAAKQGYQDAIDALKSLGYSY